MELAVQDTSATDDAELVERLSAMFPRERIHRTKMTPAMGTHIGPGLLLVAVIGDR